MGRLARAGRLLDHRFLPRGRHCGFPLALLGDSLLYTAPGHLLFTRVGSLLQLHLRPYRPFRLFAFLGVALLALLLRGLGSILHLAIRATARNNRNLDANGYSGRKI